MLKKVTRHYSIVSLLIIGTLVWSLTMVRSGLRYAFGYGLWGANGHDGVWHIALANSLSKFTLENPVYSGEYIKNYHLGFDILLALINRLTTIPISILYFQILPPIMALAIGLLVYKFVLLWRKSENDAFWATAFVYFGGGLGFIVTFLRDGVFTGESMFWSQQSVSTLVNPPFTLSLIFILAGLMFLLKYQESLSNKYYVLCTVLFGLLIQVKAYAAILVLGALFVTGIYSYCIQRTTYYIRVFVGSLFINLFLFLLVKNDSLSVFVWQPMWFLETMMSYSDRLGWERFYSAMTTYKMGRVYLKEIFAYLVAFAIFLVGNMGLRIIGISYFFKVFRKKIKIDETIVFISSIIFAGISIPMFFVQNGTPWNTIQFFYYSLFFFSILAGISIGKSLTLRLAFVFFAFFSSWSTLQHYLPKNPQAIVPNDEIEALEFLEKQPIGIVFTYPFDGNKAREAIKNPPRPLRLYDSTAYVTAYSGKQSYLEDEVNLNIVGYDWKTRRSNSYQFVTTLNLESGKEFLESNNIKYLYLAKDMSPLQGEYFRLGPKELGLSMIFENKGYIIYRYGEDIGDN